MFVAKRRATVFSLRSSVIWCLGQFDKISSRISLYPIVLQNFCLNNVNFYETSHVFYYKICLLLITQDHHFGIIK